MLIMALLTSHHNPAFLVILNMFLIALTAANPYELKLPLLHKRPPTPYAALSADKHRLSKLPLKSAASSGSGQYLVSLHLGTPPQPLLLVADTGSDLTWVSCSPCRHGSNCSHSSSSSSSFFFFPRLSTTFSPYHCYEPSCSLIAHPKKKHVHCNHTRLHSTCRYEYSYSDGSVTNGFFSRETLTFNSNNKLINFHHHLSFGCGFWNSGPTHSFNGVLGLGRGPISFPSQLGRHFSYCLLDYTLSPPPTSYLIIGGGEEVKTSKMSYTPLLINPLSPTFYYIGIQSATINDVKLRISPSVWAIDELGNGGTVVDSGTTLTFLPSPAYLRILSVFKRLVKLPVSADQPTLGFDLCLNTSSQSLIKLPQLSFKLGGGSVFSPPPENYFIDTAEDVKCLALQPVTTSDSGFSVIGNLMQQGYTFEFDKDRSRLGFSRHGCALP